MFDENVIAICKLDPGHPTHPVESMGAKYEGTRVHSTHFVVCDAGLGARYFAGWGFEVIGYSGRETGNHHLESYVLKQGDIVFLVSSPLLVSEFSHHGQSPAPDPDPEAMRHFLSTHGSGARTIAMRVEKIEELVKASLDNGAQLVRPITEMVHPDGGAIKYAEFAGMGDMTYLLIEELSPCPCILPGYQKPDPKRHSHVVPAESDRQTGLYYIDHQVINVEYGLMNALVDYHRAIFGATVSQSFTPKVPEGSQVLEAYQRAEGGIAVGTDLTALSSRVTRIGGRGKDYRKEVCLPVNEPFPGQYVDQIMEMVELGGAGIQHIALGSRDIFDTVRKLKQRGVQFLAAPGHEYYTDIKPLVIDKPNGLTEAEWEMSEELGILIDVENRGKIESENQAPRVLLQIFTFPIFTEPRLFFEVIERRRGMGFGGGNFNQLWGGIEDLQKERGHLVKTPEAMKARILADAKQCRKGAQ